MRIRGYTPDMYHALTLYFHDSRNKLQHKLTIYRLHYKNAYSYEKEPKRGESVKEMWRETERKNNKLKEEK